MGLVSMSVPDEAVEGKAVAVAARLADRPPAALRWTKHTLNHWLRQATPIFDASLALVHRLRGTGGNQRHRCLFAEAQACLRSGTPRLIVSPDLPVQSNLSNISRSNGRSRRISSRCTVESEARMS